MICQLHKDGLQTALLTIKGNLGLLALTFISRL